MSSYSSSSSVEVPLVSPFTSDDELELDGNTDSYEVDLPGCSDDNDKCQSDLTIEQTVQETNNCQVAPHCNSDDNCPHHSSSDNSCNKSFSTTGQSTNEAVNQNLTICDVMRQAIDTYKLMGDNLDMTIKARFLRADILNQSLHYFHCLAIRDRINFNDLSTMCCQGCLNSPDKIALELLPSLQTDSSLLDNFTVIVSRVIADYIPFINFALSDVVTWHLDHKFYLEMSSESEVVSVLFVV